MTNAPDRIWIEDEFGDGDEDQWTYGTWDVRNYAGYDVEYVRADIVQALTADRDRLRAASDDVIRETFESYRQAEEAYAAHLRAEADNARLREALNQSRLAFAGYVSVQSAIDLIDRAALKGETP